MNYEFALKLKEAGFPQKPGNMAYIKPPNDKEFDGEWLFLPTLSELIQACGEKFNNLHRTNVDNWACSSKNGVTLHGPTPEEAVAKLWLELNKK